MELKFNQNTEKNNNTENDDENNNTEQKSTIRHTISSGSEHGYRRYINSERLSQLRKQVEIAIRNHKTFAVKGNFSAVRNALLERGWVEKFEHRLHKSAVVTSQNNCDDLIQDLPIKKIGESIATHIEKCEKTIMSRLLSQHDVDLYWNIKRDGNEYLHRLQKGLMTNRFITSPFTSKEGLCAILQQMHWYNEVGVAYTRFPRCYNTAVQEQLHSFIEDYRLTACMSLLKWFLYILQRENKSAIVSSDGKVSLSMIQFAINRCKEYIAFKNNEDIDYDDVKTWDHEWESFLTCHNLIVHHKRKFIDESLYSVNGLSVLAKNVLKDIEQHWPQYELDGMLNIWIVKPGNRCRGRGIQLMNDVNEVLMMTTYPQVKKARYVVQKYIEKPLLIYNTKFDIRQWFLITSTQPLIIWIYKDSYLRFSSQLFDLNNFHESVHLTNNAVQCKYKNGQRDTALPDENMWDCHTFKTYLKQIEHSKSWDEIIYPGMKEAIIGAMLASQDLMDRKSNSFELYGADFMLTEDFLPWLIEINSSPDMAPTTSITARMCPQCLEDIIKVVIDKKHCSTADTGMFELIYKQHSPKPPAYLGLSLSVRGKRISRKRHFKNKLTHVTSTTDKRIANVPSVNIKEYKGPIVTDMIEELQIKTDNSEASFTMVKSAETLKHNSKKVHHKIQFQPVIARKASINEKHLLTKSFSNSRKNVTKESSAGNKKQVESAVTYRHKCNYNNRYDVHTNTLFNEWKKKIERNSKSPQKQTGNASKDTVNLKSLSAPLIKKTSPRIITDINNFFLDENKSDGTDDIRKSFFAVGLNLKSFDNTIKEKVILPESVQNKNFLNVHPKVK